MEPGFRDFPVALHGPWGHTEDGGNLILGEATEEAHLDDAALARVPLSQTVESGVDGEDFVEAVLGDGEDIDELDSDASAFAPGGLAHAGVVDEDAAHGLGGDGEEVGAIFPVKRLPAHELQVGLVDEGSGLKSVTGPLSAEVTGGEALQLRIDDIEQGRTGVEVTGAQIGEEASDLAGGFLIAVGLHSL